MKNSSKRILAMVLASSMTLSGLQLTYAVGAVEDAGQTQTQSQTDPQPSEGLEFIPNGDSTCSVTRIGTCTDTDLVIPSVSPDGAMVTEIGDWAFKYCSGLTSVDIPNSVTSISLGSFYGCSGLTSVTIPNSVTMIGDWAFYDCSGLTSITIPNSVTVIGKSAFSYCSGLTSITIYNPNCSISNYSIRSTTTICGYAGSTAEAYAKENGNPFESLTVFDQQASEGLEFTSNGDGTCSVTGIGTCTDTDLVIPSVSPDGDMVTGIGDWAFYNCSGLTSITIPNSVTSIGYGAFADCSGLTSIIVSEGNTTYHSDGNCLIDTENKKLILGCQNSVIPTDGSVTVIGESAFRGCTGLTSIAIPDGVTEIGVRAFYNCSGLTSITVSKGNTTYHSDGNCLIDTENKKLILGCQNSVIPTDGSVTVIGEGAFSSCIGLTSITIPDRVTVIGVRAFYNCSGLTSITIPNSVTDIGYAAFEGCTGLTSITIPDSVTVISDWAFRGCYSLTSITIFNPNCSFSWGSIPSTTTIYGYAGSTAEAYAKEKGNPFMALTVFDQQASEGLEFNSNGDGTCSVTGIGTCTDTDLVIPSVSPDGDAVTEIGDWAFYNCSGLTSITIPNSVTVIGERAFANCSGLASITIPDGVTEIGDAAFLNCSGLASITIPNSVTVIGDWAFSGCSSLTSITIPDSVTVIGDWAFEYCSGLTSVDIPDGVAVIGESAFSYCSGLTNIIVSEGNTTYHSDGNCLIDTENKKLILGCQNSVIPTDGSVTVIGESAFLGCIGLTSIAIPDGVTEIGDWAFEYCSGLTSITIPDSVTVIGDWAFRDCSGLTSITIPNSITVIGDWAFSDCYSLTSITIPDGVTEIGYAAFAYCSGLTSITIYNPNCSFGNESIPSTTTIYGFAGSTAEAYANENFNPFMALTKFDSAEITEKEAEDGTTYNAITVEKNELSAYSSNRTHEDGSFDLRIILAENAAVNAGDKVTLSFYKNGNATPYTITRTVDTNYVEGETMITYSNLIAAGETYVAGESCSLFGFVMTGIPANGFDTATLTVTSADGSAIAATQFNYETVAPRQ